MSKKKNTLKDLDEFLKQQAATLVSPTPLREQTEAEPIKTETPVQPVAVNTEKKPVSLESVVADLDTLGGRPALYDLVIRTLEKKNEFMPEDRMLINTALYLKHGERWKDAIREYWKGRAL